MLHEVTNENYASVLKNGLPVFLDISAVWCGPCQRLAPIVEELSQEYEGRVYFASADADNATDVTSALGIRSVPTLITYNANGEIVESKAGFQTKNALKEMIEKLL